MSHTDYLIFIRE